VTASEQNSEKFLEKLSSKSNTSGMNELQKQRIRDGIIHFSQRPALGAFKPTPCPLKPSAIEMVQVEDEEMV
jgi:hypothetical protein